MRGRRSKQWILWGGGGLLPFRFCFLSALATASCKRETMMIQRGHTDTVGCSCMSVPNLAAAVMFWGKLLDTVHGGVRGEGDVRQIFDVRDLFFA